ncbi:nuclear transport factor 2 family protein [Rhodococcus oxybenzonivorans]|uniref:nuclear transport factor 2 family protein n=1 Tax=Rhodococcus oxybenzonivorans TaxID=1990687 RepID=UPI002952A6B4|nr:nuclear transport factor 2 family protein [Rhodococcus oxybenzonivorans]MDV7355322.1 nuclear transport factor 2 family protein [Rhodococcus oxybenzonivorans]
MNEELKNLLDKQAITEVIHRYCRGVDRCDVELLESVYHPDSYDDHGYWKGNGREFAAFVAGRLTEANSATTHSVTNTLIDILDHETAHAESQVMVTLIRRGDGPPIVDLMGARYLDVFTRRHDVWRIAERTVVLDWHKCEQWRSTSNPPMSLDGFKQGARSNDPLYSFLGSTESSR